MNLTKTILDMLSPAKVASTGYRFGVCVVIGCLTGMWFYFVGYLFLLLFKKF